MFIAGFKAKRIASSYLDQKNSNNIKDIRGAR